MRMVPVAGSPRLTTRMCRKSAVRNRRGHDAENEFIWMATLRQPERANALDLVLGSDVEDYLFDGTVPITALVAERIKERVKIWGSEISRHQIEWAGLLTGPRRIKDEQDLDMVTEFFELPSYNADKQHHLTINMDDIENIDRQYPAKAFLHSHPHGNLVPTLQDWMTFLYIDFRVLQRPILYIVMAPDGNKVIFSFKKCHESKSCPLSLLKNVVNTTRLGR